MTRRTASSLLLSAATLAALTLPAAADEAGFGPGAGDFERLERLLDARSDRLADALELTPEQRAAFDRLRAEKLDGVRPTLESMRAAGRKLRAELDAARPDPTAVGTAVLDLHRLRAELRVAKEAFEREMATLLSEEQRFAWEALERARPGGERGRHGFGRGPGERGFRRRGARPER